MLLRNEVLRHPRALFSLLPIFFFAVGVDRSPHSLLFGPALFGQRCCSASLLHFLIWHPRNPRLASTKGLSGVHLTCHRGHLRFSEQIRCGTSTMCCSQITPEDTHALPFGTVGSERAVKSNSGTSRHRIHR